MYGFGICDDEVHHDFWLMLHMSLLALVPWFPTFDVAKYCLIYDIYNIFVARLGPMIKHDVRPGSHKIS